jgi:hypothetical protein
VLSFDGKIVSERHDNTNSKAKFLKLAILIRSMVTIACREGNLLDSQEKFVIRFAYQDHH